jgi:cytochrome b561
MTRYPLILRVIHWFTALMFIPMLAGGYFVIRPMASTEPLKLDALEYHMAIGVFLVALTALRLVLRWRMAHPETAGMALWAHRALYACVFLMPVSGFTMVFSARLNDIVFARNGAPLPADMSMITGHFWHGLTALVLTLLIALHIAGAFKDRATIKRMI